MQRNHNEPDSSWGLSDEDQEWFDILYAIEEQRPPDNAILAKLLRNPRYVVDGPVRAYLADHLEGKTRKPRGRPRSVETIERIQRNIVVRIVYMQALHSARALPKEKLSKSTPSEVALQETVRVLAEKKIYLSESAVKRIVYPGKKSSSPVYHM